MKILLLRLKTSTLGIMSDGGHGFPVTIPMNAIVSLADDSLNDHRLIDVTWEGKTVMMFTQDLESRGERVDAEARGSLAS